MKFSDQMAEWLVELGYDRCFFVGGGNIMHLIESLSRRMHCTPVIHEVAAGIAAEYYNECNNTGRALALVTAGPGLTNIVTAMAGAYLESRELLVIGGQVKTTDLAAGTLRQRGIQEVNGVAIVKPVCKESVLIRDTISFGEFKQLIDITRSGRKGPVFLEIPIDVQAREYTNSSNDTHTAPAPSLLSCSKAIGQVAQRLQCAQRPLFLLGGGLTRSAARLALPDLVEAGIPVATTWNAADRISADSPVFVGRPNTWGQRSANLILQQADLVVAIGTRLGLQQTGFNWRQFAPIGDVIQVDIDQTELSKGHPELSLSVCADAADFLLKLLNHELGEHGEWLQYARDVRSTIGLIENVNQTQMGYLSPYDFVEKLAGLCHHEDVIIPCSSGGAFTVMMQTFSQKEGQIIITNKGLASMGYGLSGAIGAALAFPDRRVILVEGDGGFAQNMQEIGTAKVNDLNLKIFLFDDSGYASIRMTQKSYFGGRYVGCDVSTGLGLPNWERLFHVWDVPVCHLKADFLNNPQFQALFNAKGPAAFIVPIDPQQTYYPKITSQITRSGTMESNPLHLMTPDLSDEVKARVCKYLL